MDFNFDESYLSDLPLWSEDDAQKILEDISTKHGISVDVITELVMLQRERQHQERAHGINLRIEEILGRVE